MKSNGTSVAAVARDGSWYALPATDLTELVRSGPEAVQDAVSRASGDPLADPRPSAPLRPGKVVAVGLNYLDHVRETGVEPPSAPLIFAKFPSSVIGPDESIVIDHNVTSRVDWEVELTAVIGRRLKNASEAEAMEGVLGYTVANDVSARDVQFGDGQWVRGKSLDTFCPLGPHIVSADELGDPQSLRIATRVNGRTVQDSNTSEMLFSIAEVLAYCSKSFTLEPGDVVLTGTPWGCGEFMNPRRSLSPGDVVETEIEGIGVLRNPVTRFSKVG